MPTSSFFKNFVVTDEKAIEQFLYDLEKRLANKSQKT